MPVIGADTHVTETHDTFASVGGRALRFVQYWKSGGT